ncbi:MULTISPECIES: Arc family DNA-binding protein [Acinetobacter]|uniref:Arc family DNA-binding protein n=1 Tax=Acinetobacter baumannii TaxID=470 RepID=A0A6I4HRY2_ACIBA|nr:MULTISPECIES: Arc family DNA-binding protein [Acinetobacter]AWL18222.1 Arc family DNA-binding protein [Acinetobacter nosocomialis]AYY88440.1 Arc family DNA-binding protein [Acinetobacter baumannii]EHU2311151.1 Arc family DNA-binding protein [Acinetobacter baumannii]EKT9118159.1 Arc family DNA-binding protein [Acinetobacter baumannii]EKV6960485.1 Arc family DNA-binding protein [Acinetobacter baumannii]
MARTDPQVNFRIPAELKDKLDNAAKENGRTLTAELILRLEMTFEHDDHIQDLIDRIEKLEDTVSDLEYHANDHSRRIDNLEGRY